MFSLSLLYAEMAPPPVKGLGLGFCRNVSLYKGNTDLRASSIVI